MIKAPGRPPVYLSIVLRTFVLKLSEAPRQPRTSLSESFEGYLHP